MSADSVNNISFSFTEDEIQQFGREIIAGMHSEIYNWDIEQGRIEMKLGLELPSEEELKEAGLTEIPEYAYRAVEFTRSRLEKQASFIAKIALDKLAEMKPEIFKTK